jgi:hypothetical protein
MKKRFTFKNRRIKMSSNCYNTGSIGDCAGCCGNIDSPHIETKITTDIIEAKIITDINVSQDSSVNHPPHYNQGNLEVIEVIKDWGFAEDFCAGNAIKYISRYKYKSNPVEDLKKARWYIDYLIKTLEEKSED